MPFRGHRHFVLSHTITDKIVIPFARSHACSSRSRARRLKVVLSTSRNLLGNVLLFEEENGFLRCVSVARSPSAKPLKSLKIKPNKNQSLPAETIINHVISFSFTARVF